jgi:hypothetical protein
VSRLHHRHIGRRLGAIWQFTDRQDWPHIGTLVTNKDTGECGRGVTEVLNPILERQKVKAFDWSQTNLKFKNYLKKTKAAKEESESKIQKRSYEDAKELFIDYWKKVKEEVKTSSTLIDDILSDSSSLAKFRKDMISKVESGYAPASALSDHLLAIINSKKLPSKQVAGFVYIGEYQDCESGNALFDKIKIGFTEVGIEERAKALGGGVISPLKFVMTHAWSFSPGYAYIAEQKLHGIFHEYREMGEFFLSKDGYTAERACEIVKKLFNEVANPILIDGTAI